MEPQRLDAIQRWMMSVITHPQGIEEGISETTAQREFAITPGQIEDLILPSESCSSFQRLSVYNNAYFARLIECLTSEFPTVKRIVGDDSFAAFVVAYLRQSPPGSYTLGDLGRGFAASLRATRPPRKPDNPGPDWADFLIDLATLERLYADVFDGPGEERLPRLSAESLRLVPPHQWPHVRFEFAPSFQLARFQFPVQETISQIRSGEIASIPDPIETFLIVHRRDYIVRRIPVNAIQYRLLEELHSGKPLAEAMGASMEEMRDDELVSPVELQNWFYRWTAAGLFIGVSTDEDH